MKCQFVVGQKVTPSTGRWTFCVPGHIPQWLYPPVPVSGRTYTITEINPDGDDVFLCFRETPENAEYDYSGFRPLQDRPDEAATDIGVFRRLLRAREMEPS